MSENTKKKRTVAIIAVVVFAAISLVAAFVAVPYIRNAKSRSEISAQSSEEFKRLLADHSVADSPFGFEGLKSASYAVTTGEDSIEIIELGYKKDTVIEMYDTVCYDTDGMTDAEYEEFDEAVRNRCEAIANEKYASYDIKSEDGKYTLVMHFYALDDAQNVNDLITLGIISNYSDRESDTVSFADTETSLVKMGFVKR